MCHMVRRAASPSRSGSPSRSSIDFGDFRETPQTVWRAPLEAFDPKYRTTERVHAELRAIERADHELMRLAPAREGLLQRIRRETLARNAFATASIEGNPLTLAEVESILRVGASPASSIASHKDELEILNYADLMGKPVAKKAPRSPADVRAVHAALFRQVFPDAGAWKKRPNFIGRRGDMRVVYVPTPPERVEKELASALDWLHDAREHHPLVRVMLFHHEFESIHPFRDGNGRTGRALTQMALRELGYAGCDFAPIDYQIYRTRAEYYDNLALVETNRFADHTPWIEYMLRIAREAYERGLELARFDRALPAGLPERQRRVAEWFAALRAEEPKRRVKFHDVHAAFPEIAERTLKRDLTALRDAGILDAEGERRGTSYRLG